MAEPRLDKLPPKADGIFVNRDGPLQVFAEAVDLIPPDGAIICVFHGPGGQGKTALRHKLWSLVGPDGEDPYAHLIPGTLDLKGKPRTEPERLSIWIRNSFAQAGVAFPCFDILLAIYWEAARGDEPFPVLVNGWLAKATEALPDVAPEAVTALGELAKDAVNTIPGMGLLLTQGSKWIIDRSRRAMLERTRPEAFAPLQRPGVLQEPHQLGELLPWMLAQDLNQSLAEMHGRRLVLFVDEYEGVFDQGGAGVRWKENPFDRHLRRLVSETKGLLLVFFSREKLPWAEDPHWRDDLEGAQISLTGLHDDDAREWLRLVPIVDAALADAMIDGARETTADNAPVYPLLLDLQIEHWRNLAAVDATISPETFRVAHASFEARRNELVARVLRDYGDPIQATLQRLSVASRFDRTAFKHVVRTFETGLPMDAFDRIATMSFITQGEDGFFAIHGPIAEVICATLDKVKYTQTLQGLLEHFESRAKVASPKHVTDMTVGALVEAADLRRKLGAENYVEWLRAASAPVAAAARFAQMEILWRLALEVADTALGSDHPDTAASYNNVASNLDNMGRFDEAETLYRKALEIRESAYGSEHPRTAESYNNLGSNLNRQGNYLDAELLFRKALAILERIQGANHLDTVTGYSNVAFNLDDQGRQAEAEPLHKRVLDVRLKTLGDDHLLTARGYNNLASNLGCQSRYAAAELLYQKALGVFERVLGKDHPDTATAYNNVSTNLEAQGRYKEAEKFMRMALDIRDRILDTDHPDKAISYNNLASILDAQHRHKEAELLYKKGLEIFERKLDTDHPLTAMYYNNVATNLDEQGRSAEAEPLYRKALDVCVRVLGPDHPRAGLP